MAVVIKKCDCKHEYQDKTYGNGKRVYNTNAEGTKAKCTVCGNVINLNK